MKSMIEKMLKMQRTLDNAIYKEHQVEFDKEKCKLAMMDEIGEFNHEIKATWCWWKKTQAPVDREKALEELVDIWHFALSLTYHTYDNSERDYEFNKNSYSNIDDLSQLYDYLLCDDWHKLDWLYRIGNKFGFSLGDVYAAYIEKNKVNYERLANNY